jgi:hypothetical protein
MQAPLREQAGPRPSWPDAAIRLALQGCVWPGAGRRHACGPDVRGPEPGGDMLAGQTRVARSRAETCMRARRAWPGAGRRHACGPDARGPEPGGDMRPAGTWMGRSRAETCGRRGRGWAGAGRRHARRRGILLQDARLADWESPVRRKDSPASARAPVPTPRFAWRTPPTMRPAVASTTPARAGGTLAYRTAAVSGNRSWIGCTASGSVRIPSIARTQASAAGSVVMQGTP